MIWVLLGLLTGCGWAVLGHGTFLAAPLHALTAALAATGSAGTSALVRAAGLGSDSVLAHVVGPVVGVLTPGMACLAVAEAVATSRSARTAAATTLTAAAFTSFLWLPAPQALALLLVALGLDAVLAFGRGPFLLLPSATLISAVAATLAFDIATGGRQLAPAATLVAAHLGGAPGLWRLMLAAAALAPAGAALTLLVRRR